METRLNRKKKENKKKYDKRAKQGIKGMIKNIGKVSKDKEKKYVPLQR